MTCHICNIREQPLGRNFEVVLPVCLVIKIRIKTFQDGCAFHSQSSSLDLN